MSGLSERKKESRKKKIFDAALKLFEAQGYDKTTMAEIAVNADMAVGTLYNYYASKQVLLFSIIEAGAGQYMDRLDTAACSGADLKASVFEFFMIYLDSFSTYGKRVWRELFGAVMFKKTELLESIDSIDKPFLSKLRDLLTLLRDRQMLREHTDVETVVSGLYAILAYNIMRYVSDDGISEEDLKTALLSQAALIVDAVKKQN
jgi:AcrR family transcriptional regulator